MCSGGFAEGKQGRYQKAERANGNKDKKGLNGVSKEQIIFGCQSQYVFVNRIKTKLTNVIDLLFISKYIVQFHKRSPRTKGWDLLGPGCFPWRLYDDNEY